MKTITRFGNYFNKFLLQLDHMPNCWEDRAALFCVYMTQRGAKSATLRSYISAIKCVLKDDDYEWNDSLVMLTALTRICKNQNDVVKARMPIQCHLLELVLFKIDRTYLNDQQVYLAQLYKMIIAIGYYRMFRIGKLVIANSCQHTMKAKDVHIAFNKDKILVILYSSKTHDKNALPQKIKITGNGKEMQKFFCPFKLIKEYTTLGRGGGGLCD